MQITLKSILAVTHIYQINRRWWPTEKCWCLEKFFSQHWCESKLQLCSSVRICWVSFRVFPPHSLIFASYLGQPALSHAPAHVFSQEKKAPRHWLSPSLVADDWNFPHKHKETVSCTKVFTQAHRKTCVHREKRTQKLTNTNVFQGTENVANLNI